MLALVLASFTLFATFAVVMVGLRTQCSALLHAARLLGRRKHRRPSAACGPIDTDHFELMRA